MHACEWGKLQQGSTRWKSQQNPHDVKQWLVRDTKSAYVCSSIRSKVEEELKEGEANNERYGSQSIESAREDTN